MISELNKKILKHVTSLYFLVFLMIEEKTGVAKVPINMANKMLMAVVWFESAYPILLRIGSKVAMNAIIVPYENIMPIRILIYSLFEKSFFNKML